MHACIGSGKRDMNISLGNNTAFTQNIHVYMYIYIYIYIYIYMYRMWQARYIS